MASKTTTVSFGVKPYASPFYSIGRYFCHNMYLEIAQSLDAKKDSYLIKIPGLRRFGVIPSSNQGACRGSITCGNGRTFKVFGSAFCEILQDGSRSFIGNLASYMGVVSMVENGYQLILVDGVNGWILNFVDSNWTRITDEYFPGNSQATKAPTHVVYIDTYFVVNIPDSIDYYWSESYYQRAHDNTMTDYDPLEPNGYWSPINSGKKIGKPDNIVALANVNNYLWLFGKEGNEVHYDTGLLDSQLFARYEGAILNFGCSAPYSVATINSSVFWLSTDSRGTLGVFTNDGMAPRRVSTRGVEQIIEDFGTFADCIGFCYAQSGHVFYVMQFPTAGRTFVYDLVTDAWHERNSLEASTGRLRAWRGMFPTANFGRMLLGDNAYSTVYELDPTYYLNDNPADTGVNYIRCSTPTPIQFSMGVNVRYDWAQVICNQGQGLPVDTADGVGVNPKVFLAYSNDTGITYTNEREAPLGRQGEYSKRSMVPGLGMGRNRVFRVTMTDPVPFILVALLLHGQECAF